MSWRKLGRLDAYGVDFPALNEVTNRHSFLVGLDKFSRLERAARRTVELPEPKLEEEKTVEEAEESLKSAADSLSLPKVLLQREDFNILAISGGAAGGAFGAGALVGLTAAGQRPDLLGVVLHYRVADRDLPVAGDHHPVALAHGDDGRAMPAGKCIVRHHSLQSASRRLWSADRNQSSGTR